MSALVTWLETAKTDILPTAIVSLLISALVSTTSSWPHMTAMLVFAVSAIIAWIVVAIAFVPGPWHERIRSNSHHSSPV